MTGAAVLDQICQYLAGPYDSVRKFYATPGAPVIPGLFVVKRAPTKSLDEQLWSYGATTPQASGAIAIVTVDQSDEQRIAVAGQSGIKKVAWDVEITVDIHSTSRDAEDVYDFTNGLRDALLARIRADKTCGSGGFEAGATGFQLAETFPWLRSHMGPPRTSSTITKQSLTLLTEAHQYVQA